MTLSVRNALSLAAAVALVAGPGLAQTKPATPAPTAAAVLPNAFDAPAPAAQARPAPAAAPAQAPAGDAQAAEAALRAVIEQFAAGDITEALYTPGVATRLNASLAEYSRLVRSFGAVESVEAQSVSGGVGQFVVIFEKAATQWQVGLDEAGLVAAVRFRETPPESSEPPAPGA